MATLPGTQMYVLLVNKKEYDTSYSLIAQQPKMYKIILELINNNTHKL